MGNRTNATQSRAALAYGPGHSAFAVTPSNTAHLQQNGQDVIVRGVFVGVAGNITGEVFTESGTAATVAFVGLAAGTVLNVAFTHIHVTGTTATSIVGLL